MKDQLKGCFFGLPRVLFFGFLSVIPLVWSQRSSLNVLYSYLCIHRLLGRLYVMTGEVNKLIRTRGLRGPGNG